MIDDHIIETIYLHPAHIDEADSLILMLAAQENNLT
jgi:hypothetical protein